MQYLIIITLIFMTSCAAQQLNQNAEQVRFIQQDSKGCIYLGEATGSQGDFFTGGWTSNENLETGARNALKNKVAEMGGNAVVLLTNRAGNTGSSGAYGGGVQQTNVALAGIAYRCPKEATN